MDQKYKVSVSVRSLIEFLLRSGDISLGRSASASDMVEGTKAHRKLQKAAGEGYEAEVRLKFSSVISPSEVEKVAQGLGYAGEQSFEIELKIDGICDGILQEDGAIVIDEIKSTADSLDNIESDTYPLHWAQARCYGFIYAAQQGLDELRVRLTYYQIESGEVKRFYRSESIEQLAEFFYGLIDEYKKWAVFDVIHSIEREDGAENLTFPYGEYRKGQRELAAACYRVINGESTLYAQAPTGTGKTMSVLFGAAKTLYNKKKSLHGRKIFYLTAKSVTGDVAVKACHALADSGFYPKNLRFGWRCMVVTAKEKTCGYNKQCDPEVCPFACGHYDRVNAAIMDILSHESVITQNILKSYAEKHNVCEFEFSLDVSERCDVIICDYNYAFDPRASLRRYFTSGGDYLLLVDEAHNLIDRGRDMYSCGISKRSVLKAAATLKHIPPLAKRLKKINAFILKLKKSMESDRQVLDPPSEFYSLCSAFCESFGVYLSDRIKGTEDKEVLELYFDMNNLGYLYSNYDEEHFRFYVENRGGDTYVKMFCADPSEMLEKVYNKCAAAVFFSATLLPSEYCKKFIGRKNSATDEGYEIRLPSPFESENLNMIIGNGISAEYKYRDSSYIPCSEYIMRGISGKVGNYLAFFPSFAYLEKVYEIFCERYPHIKVFKQTPELTEGERTAFLENFINNPIESMVGFAVLGGIFSEGIDLVGERLSGAFIVSVGIPQLCFERDLIKEIFDAKGESGYDYAYRFPGFNRVLQAAGRVIRSESDRGFVMLLDRRFLESRYTQMFPSFWKKLYIAKSPDKAGELTEKFWDQKG